MLWGGGFEPCTPCTWTAWTDRHSKNSSSWKFAPHVKLYSCKKPLLYLAWCMRHRCSLQSPPKKMQPEDPTSKDSQCKVQWAISYFPAIFFVGQVSWATSPPSSLPLFSSWSLVPGHCSPFWLQWHLGRNWHGDVVIVPLQEPLTTVYSLYAIRYYLFCLSTELYCVIVIQYEICVFDFVYIDI